MASHRLGDLGRDAKVLIGLISASEFVNHTYLTLLPPVLAVVARDLNVSLAAMGVAIGLQAFVNVALQLPFGHLADNYDRTYTLGGCLLVSAVGTLVLAAAPTFEWLLVGQVLLGVGIAGHHPLHYPLLSDASHESLRGRVFSVFGFVGNLGFGAPAAIYVVVTAVPGLTWRHTFALIGVAGVAFAVVSVAVLRSSVPASVRRPNRSTEPAPDQGRTVRSRIARELRSISRSPLVLVLGVLAFLFSSTIWGVTTYLVTLLERGYGVPTATASLALTVMFVAGAVYKLVGGALTDRYGSVPVIAGTGIVSGVSVLVLASLVISPTAAVVAGVLGGNVVSLAVPARDKLTDLLSARDEIGRNFAIITIGVMVGNTLAPPIFGVLVESAGYQTAFVGIAAIGFAIVGLVGGMAYTWREEMT